MIRETTIFSKWLDQSRAEGKIEGKRTLLRKQLEKKFEQLSHELEIALSNLNAEQLDDLATDVLDLKDLDNLRMWLNSAAMSLARA